MHKVYHAVQLPLLICQYCNQFFTVSSYDLKRNPIFCSNRCRTKHKGRNTPTIEEVTQLYVVESKSANAVGRILGTSETTILRLLQRYNIPIRSRTEHLTTRNPMSGKTHTEEARQKIREANRRQFSSQEARDRHASLQRQAMADGKFKIISKAEKAVAQELNRLNIAHTPQYLIRDPQTGQYCACVDIMLSGGIAIEVNGTYWHADPRFYPDGPIHASQKKTVENDARKAQALKSLSIPLIVIWEHDIKTNPSLAVQNALQALPLDLSQPRTDVE